MFAKPCSPHQVGGSRATLFFFCCFCCCILCFWHREITIYFLPVCNDVQLPADFVRLEFYTNIFL